MHVRDARLILSPTDLANFLACRHKTELDVLVAFRILPKPDWKDPLAEAMRRRGNEHERIHVESLRAQGLTVTDLSAVDRPESDDRAARTIDAMRKGDAVIVQAALQDQDHEWMGYADVLRKIDRPSPGLGAWSYEVHDTKLSRETRGGTILQLCVYSELVGAIQGQAPEYFHVVTPAGPQSYRFDDFGAYYRTIRGALRAAKGQERLEALRSAKRPASYPEPTEHCAVCRWSPRCNAQRRKDDHLTFVAGLGRHHQKELGGQEIGTLAGLAVMPVPLTFRPDRGAKETYEKLGHQARLQKDRRDTGTLPLELLAVQEGLGLAGLPAPRPGDLFLDLEGDPFGRGVIGAQAGESGREYLFGLGRVVGDRFVYTARWAFSDEEERAAFDAVMTDFMAALAADPDIHIYHYGHYEPSAFKRLMGRYATREADVDRLLRGGRFVDLLAVVRHALRAGVEHYSIKDLEPFYEFKRDVDLDEAGDQRRLVEVALETNAPGDVTPEMRAAVEGYNRDDCRSTLELQRWLERLRAEAGGDAKIPRPTEKSEAPSDQTKERDQEIERLRSTLLAGIPADRALRTDDQQARYLLAHLVAWYRVEERVAWGDYHRLRAMTEEDLAEQRRALVGLQLVSRTPPTGRRSAYVDRYSYPVQENDVSENDDVYLPTDVKIGQVAAIDRAGLTIDIKKVVEHNEVHPETVLALRIFRTPEQEKSIQRIAAHVIAHGIDDGAGDRLVNDVLLSRAPRLCSGSFVQPDDGSATDFAVKTVFELDDSLLAIQGPPGSGKTFTGARMIADLVAAGRKVGVVATGHKVIRKLLLDAGKAAGGSIQIAHKPGDDELEQGSGFTVEEPGGNDVALAWLKDAGGRVLGGTAWLWAREDFAKSVDVLFVDEAGQMSLANVLAVAPAAKSLVLLGDPCQLDQPTKGAHPDGVDVSALDHILAGHQTMPKERGIFLTTTWRLAPAICAFTSEMFYEGRLAAKAGLERQVLARKAVAGGLQRTDVAGGLQPAGRFTGAGLFVAPVEHDGNRTASGEEAAEVRSIVEGLLAPGSLWIDEKGVEHQMTPADILVVAPFNAHVRRIRDVLGRVDVAVGTVDKFQGQEAPVVIYSLATSRPEDAPRGMEFLYSLNRLNVATSRAKCACIVVVSPRLFEPECRTPRQMQLANALARYCERAVEVGSAVAE